MRLPTLRRPRAADGDSATAGPARLDRRTKRLTQRLKPGDVAIIDHVDIDRVAGDALVASGVSAVINAAPSISGRYPNLGPEVIVAAGITLVDAVGQEIFDRVREGQRVRVDGANVYLGDEIVATGQRQDTETVAAAMTEAKAGLSVQL